MDSITNSKMPHPSPAPTVARWVLGLLLVPVAGANPEAGAQLADALGVSQPTVTNHLRAAQRKLLAAIFEEE